MQEAAIFGGGFGFVIGIVIFALWIVFAVMGVIFFHRQNSSHTRKLNKEERESIEYKYRWLKDKDIFLYYKIYNQTFELLKNIDCHKEVFENIFEKYFQSENEGFYEEFKDHKKQKESWGGGTPLPTETANESPTENNKTSESFEETKSIATRDKVFILAIIVLVVIALLAVSNGY